MVCAKVRQEGIVVMVRVRIEVTDETKIDDRCILE